MDILQDLTINELLQIQTLAYERMGLEKSTFMVNFLHNCIEWMETYPDDPYVKVMSSHGNWKQHLTLVADIVMPNQNAVFFFSLEESNAELTEALLKTDRILWHNKNLLTAIYDFNASAALALDKSGKMKIADDVLCYMVRIDKEVALKLDQSIPDGVSLGKLDSSSAVMVNSVWPHRFKGSERFISSVVDRNDSVALFIDGKLASWAFICNMGLIASLQTLKEYGGRGLGKAVTRILSRKVALKGRDLCGTVVINNDVSRKLFIKLGYKVLENKVSFFELDTPLKH